VWGAGGNLAGIRAGDFAFDTSDNIAETDLPLVSPDESAVAWIETSTFGVGGRNLMMADAHGARSVLSDFPCIDRFVFGSNNALFVARCTGYISGVPQTVTMSMVPALSSTSKDVVQNQLARGWVVSPQGDFVFGLDGSSQTGGTNSHITRVADGQSV